jgi:7-carboxy-7-deazaguanine synthase
MKVSEIFYSLQGEGGLAGVPSVFIRLAGCPLRCRWCDTEYAWSEESGRELDIERIIAETERHDTDYVVVTGGEPMVQNDLPELLKRLKSKGKHITVETAGIVYRQNLACDLMSISPKLSNAGLKQTGADEFKSPNVEVLKKLTAEYDYQLKFVIEKPEDIGEVHEILERIGDIGRDKIFLMPQARSRRKFLDKAALVARLCRDTGFRFSERLQILLWDKKRGV